MLILVDCSTFLGYGSGFAVAGLPWLFILFVFWFLLAQLVAFLGGWPNGLFIWNFIIYGWLGFWFLLVWPDRLLIVWMVGRRLVIGLVGRHVVCVGVLGCWCNWFSSVQVVAILCSAVCSGWVNVVGLLGFSLSCLCSRILSTYCDLIYFFYGFTELNVTGLWSILNCLAGWFALLGFAGSLVDYTTWIKDGLNQRFFWYFWTFWVLVLKHLRMLLGIFVLLASRGPELVGFFF